MKNLSLKWFWILLIGNLLLSACAYRLYSGPLKPLPEDSQGTDMSVADDGTVSYVRGRLEIGLRPMTDDELNRQFASASKGGNRSTNPYTFGDWKPMGEQRTPSRFTVFRLSVKNYTYPKVRIDVVKMRLVAANKRKYRPLSLADFKEQYYPFAVGYAGNAYSRFENRNDILQRTLYRSDFIFSGQEHEGYVVFPGLHNDVRQITVYLDNIVLRYDSFNRPIETLDIAFQFHRDVFREQ